MTKRAPSTRRAFDDFEGADGLWPGRVSMGLTDQGRKDRRHVSSRSKTVVTEKVAEWERARDGGLGKAAGYGMADSTTRARVGWTRCSGRAQTAHKRTIEM